MLRLRLFYGLLTLVILLWSVGGASLLLMRESSAGFDRRLREDYQVIDSSQSVRTYTATLNAHYVPLITTHGMPFPPDRALYDKTKPQLDQLLASIRTNQSRDEHWRTLVARVDQAFDGYFTSYDQIFAAADPSQGERDRMMRDISGHTLRLTDLTENVMTLGEQTMFAGADQLGDESGKNLLFVSTLVLVGTMIAILIYFQLHRQLVDPVASLQRSIEEVRKGNFELSLPELNPGSEFSKVVAAFNDMAAELKRRRGETDDNLMRANMVNRAILSAIPSPVFVLGDDSGLVEINPAAEKLSDKLGVTGRLPLKIQRILDECRETSAHFLPEDPREALLFRVDEKEFFYLPRIFRFESEDGSQSGWAVLLHNVSRIRWLDDMKTNLLSTVSHEIKTPLTGIRMVLHLLLEERTGHLEEMQRVMVTSANDDCERLLVTLNSLLDLSRAESGATHLKCVPTSMREAVDRAASLHGAAAAARGVRIRIEQQESTGRSILADPVRLDEVMNNLVSNAIKHSPEHGVVTLRISRPDADHLRASVLDEGPGVPDCSQSRIFERFYRAPGQEADGVGLGLFISREIMRAHEGRIGLRERSGDLTEFYIDVPLC